MQISPTPPQLHLLKEIWDWIVWPLSSLILRKSYQGIKKFIVLNVNRIREETVIQIQAHMDEKFQSHEINAFKRITDLENTVKGLQQDVQSLMRDRK